MYNEPITTNSNLYWIGPRESDIEAVKGQFVGSITFFGNGGTEGYAHSFDGRALSVRGNHTISRDVKVNHNNMDDTELDRHVYEWIGRIQKEDSNAKFMMYNANVVRLHDRKSVEKISRGEVITDEEREARFLYPVKFYQDNFVCLNSDEIMEVMDSKINFHRNISKVISDENMLEIQLMNGKEIDSYTNLCQRFDVDSFSGVRFIVQENYASGGAGTHIVSRPKHDERLSFIHDEKYIVSILQENNISVNAHIIVFKDRVLLLPGSIQIIRENNKRLMYRGADFITYREIDKRLRDKFEELAVIIATRYQSGMNLQVEGIDGKGRNISIDGFRGILGIDAIIHDGKVKILECNNRFQSSSNLLNYALREMGLPSLQQMCYHANGDYGIAGQGSFATVEGMIRKVASKNLTDCTTVDEFGDRYDYSRLDIDVNYSNFNFVDSGSNIIHAKRMFAIADYYTSDTERARENFLGYVTDKEIGRPNACIYTLERDGYRPELSYHAYSYLFRISFNAPITAVSPEGTLRLNENIVETDRVWSDMIYDFDPLATKISLMTQGLNIDKSEQTAALLERLGGFREATNDAIDIYLRRPGFSTPKYTEMVVNSPLGIRYTPFSPFSLRANGDSLCLYYYNTVINDNIGLFPSDPLADKIHPSGYPYSDVAFLSGDRLRVHVTNTCRFRKDRDHNGEDYGCHFCNMKNGEKECDTFDADIIRDVVSDYLALGDSYRIDHFLVGGQSPVDPDMSATLRTVSVIHALAPNKHIYLMSTPPRNLTDILKLSKAGVTEFSFNIELYNHAYAKKYMPGKSAHKRSDYLSALNAARFIMNDDDKSCVRTMFIVGLETISSLKQGLRVTIDNGIQPMLSVFRPMPGTKCENLLPPSLRELYMLYNEIEQWCEERELHLGPTDIYCQNNTLSLPY